MSMRILLTGVTGQVGSELAHTLMHLGEIVAPDRTELDLTNPVSVGEKIRAIQPRWIVNSAAYTAVDKAESEPELAYAINAEAVRVIGEGARAIRAGVIHFSTDYVFAGTGTAPYVETDATAPVSVYGASKLAGEHALTATGTEYMVFRTSWIYGATGKNFLRTILKAARERDKLQVVADQHGAPTWSRDLARMAAQVIEQVEDRATQRGWKEALRSFSGIYHAAGAGETSWFEFATEAIRREYNRDPRAKLAEVEAIPTAEYPTAAKRPMNSRLNCGKLKERFGWRMMDWRDSLSEVMKEL